MGFKCLKSQINCNQARPGHFYRFPLFSVADGGKNWKCPGLAIKSKKREVNK